MAELSVLGMLSVGQVSALLFVAAVTGKDSLAVETTLGKLIRFTSFSRSGREYYSFIAIPFARPPVGPLRFQEIHSGGYLAGVKSNTGPQYLMDEDVVIMDINYRLGKMGLFQGAIAESGTSYNFLSVLPPGLAKKRTNTLANLVSCPQDSTEKTVSCLQKKDAREIIARLEDFREWQVDPLLLFQPALEPVAPGAFLTGPMSSWELSPVPILMGTNSAEGLLRTGYILNYNMDFKWYNDNFGIWWHLYHFGILLLALILTK